jgi:hypothetical protein
MPLDVGEMSFEEVLVATVLLDQHLRKVASGNPVPMTGLPNPMLLREPLKEPLLVPDARPKRRRNAIIEPLCSR